MMHEDWDEYTRLRHRSDHFFGNGAEADPPVPCQHLVARDVVMGTVGDGPSFVWTRISNFSTMNSDWPDGNQTSHGLHELILAVVLAGSSETFQRHLTLVRAWMRLDYVLMSYSHTYERDHDTKYLHL